MFRRHRHDGGDQDTFDQAQADDLPGDGPAAARPATARSGPWDAADRYPAADRIDCGSLLIPVHDDFDVQINVAQEQGVWVAVVRGDSSMQLQAFAAPRGGGLWDEVRQEIAQSVAESGGRCQDQAGAFGAELLMHVPVVEQGMADAADEADEASQTPGQAGRPGYGYPANGHAAEGHPADGHAGDGHAADDLLGDDLHGDELHPVRFIGFDGPRWFLRGLVSGPAAGERSIGAMFDEIFASVVVVRGDHPVPPREQLEIRLPEEARQALEAQFTEENTGWDLPNPFERGPEITETR